MQRVRYTNETVAGRLLCFLFLRKHTLPTRSSRAELLFRFRIAGTLEHTKCTRRDIPQFAAACRAVRSLEVTPKPFSEKIRLWRSASTQMLVLFGSVPRCRTRIVSKALSFAGPRQPTVSTPPHILAYRGCKHEERLRSCKTRSRRCAPIREVIDRGSLRR